MMESITQEGPRMWDQVLRLKDQLHRKQSLVLVHRDTRLNEIKSETQIFEFGKDHSGKQCL